MYGQTLDTLDKRYPNLEMLSAFGGSNFQFLVAVMLSARSKDEMTIPISKKLFSQADNPEDILKMGKSNIEKILKPIGFYRSKTKNLIGLCETLIDEYNGVVPKNREDLMKLPGVGRKTANVVLSQLFYQDAIAVDIHVHRISNRLGWVKTKTPEDTELALMKIVPRSYWKIINRVMVNHGQKVCRPISPKCELCPIKMSCEYYLRLS